HVFACYETIIDTYTERARSVVSGQLDLFSAFSEEAASAKPDVRHTDGYRYPDIPEFSGREKLLLEREATGQCFSGHLLDDYLAHMERLKPTEIGDILATFEHADAEDTGGTVMPEVPADTHDFADKQVVNVVGVVSKRVAKLTKKGDSMAFVTIEDRYAEIEVIIFPKVLESCAAYLSYDTAIFVSGELSVREEEAPKILARTVFPLRTNEALQNEPENGEASVPQPEKSTPQQTQTTPSKPVSAPQQRMRAISDTPIPPTAKTLFLRVPHAREDDLPFAHAKNYAGIFEAIPSSPGHTVAVVFFDEETRQYHRGLCAPMALTPYVLHQFEVLLGKENVILR
ncbi:MAG: hypothetical protein IJ302_00995, partial [Clostridia bacterium]|nr:hypothetical protein [Clostridia bacterium]